MLDISFIFTDVNIFKEGTKDRVIVADAVSTQIILFQGFLVLTGIVLVFLSFLGYKQLQNIIEEKVKKAAEEAVNNKWNVIANERKAVSEEIQMEKNAQEKTKES